MKDVKSLLLLLLSFGLVTTWVYHLYDKNIYSRQSTEAYIKDSISVADAVRDSLQARYSITLSEMDTQLDSTKNNADSLKGELDSKLSEIYKLRNDIRDILKNRKASNADMALASDKIKDLQLKVNDLRNQNMDMEQERQRLSGVLEQLSNDMKGLEENTKRLSNENKMLTEKINLASIFVASEISLTPVTVKNDKEIETNIASKTSKFIISFTVQNNISENPNAEVVIVVTQPGGSVLQNSVWDAGSFDTKNEGRKKYSLKFKFEYEKGDPKHLVFSLNADDYNKGSYTLQIYHNGFLIGKAVKVLK